MPMQTLTTPKLQEMTQQYGNLAVINVLPEDDFRKEHIPKTKNVPLGLDDFEERVEKIAGSREKPVVVYCASVDCEASPKAAKKLEEAGFSKVYDYEDGMRGWKEAGLRVEKGK